VDALSREEYGHLLKTYTLFLTFFLLFWQSRFSGKCGHQVRNNRRSQSFFPRTYQQFLGYLFTPKRTIYHKLTLVLRIFETSCVGNAPLPMRFYKTSEEMPCAGWRATPDEVSTWPQNIVWLRRSWPFARFSLMRNAFLLRGSGSLSTEQKHVPQKEPCLCSLYPIRKV
jgi:hypothetical protein